MKRRTRAHPRPPRSATRSTLTTRTTHSTVSHQPLPKHKKPPLRAARAPKPILPPKARIGRIVSDEESSLLDLIDNLLEKGVMLNADLVLALANVDLIYIRLSALLCAADRVMPVTREGR
jgi:hypothetical protein